MISPSLVFESICVVIEPMLVADGFIKIEENKDPDYFGSQYITFEDNRERIRITWDGKEQWFVMETIPLNSPTCSSGWADILLQFFRPQEATEKTVKEIVADMSASLSAYLNTIDK